ncbi:tetratricopeptide repeat protein [Streptomyces cyaneofuscatus]|uniref:tetratricopeptide repeat protein n=1 Tax=Streptomyces cyaneofuscatus TaxID=66883 RepID=UPI003330309B
MNQTFALPGRDPSFIGRTELMDDVLPGYLDQGGDGVPVVLNGPVGIGKTVASSELAHRQRTRYAEVSWIDMAIAGSGPPADRIAAWLTAVRRATGTHLLVLDGVLDPSDVVRELPRDETRILITSRADAGLWRRSARVIQVPALSREESVRLLMARAPELAEADAGRLAGALDDLPLAMENAASWLTSGMTPLQVLGRLKASASSILSGYRSSDFEGSLAGRLSEAMSALAAGTEEDRRTLRLLHALAVLGPEPLSTRALRGDQWQVPDSDRHHPLTIYDLHRRLGGLRDRGLTILETGSARLDEISGAVIRDLLVARPRDRAAAFALAEQLVVAAVPERAPSEGAWGDWALIAQTCLALDPANIHTEPGRRALLGTYGYLVDSGRYRDAIGGLGELRTVWVDHLAQHRADAHQVMSVLARAHFGCGNYEVAEQLDLQVYREREEKLGSDDSRTMTALASYALDLGARGYHSTACRLAQHAWREQRRLLGEESREAMRAGSYLARLETAQEPDRAYRLGSRVHRLQKTRLGAGHQHTLDTAHHLALCLVELNEFGKALPLLEKTLEGRLATLSAHHPDTLWTAAHFLRLSADLGRTAPGPFVRLTYDRLCGLFGKDHPVVRRLATLAER